MQWVSGAADFTASTYQAMRSEEEEEAVEEEEEEDVVEEEEPSGCAPAPEEMLEDIPDYAAMRRFPMQILSRQHHTLCVQ